MEERKNSPKPLGAPVKNRASIIALALNMLVSYLCVYSGLIIGTYLVKQTRLAVSITSSIQLLMLGISTGYLRLYFSPLLPAVKAVLAFYAVSGVGSLIGANFISRGYILILLIVVSSVQGTVGMATLCVSTLKTSILQALAFSLGIDIIFLLSFGSIYIEGSLLVSATLLFVADAVWRRKYNWAAWALAGSMSIISGTLFVVVRRTPAVGGAAAALLALAAVLVILTLLQSKQMSKKEKLVATTCVVFNAGGFIVISWNKHGSGFALALGYWIGFFVIALGWSCYSCSLKKPKQTQQMPELNLTEPEAAESVESEKRASETDDVLVDVETEDRPSAGRAQPDVFVDIELGDS